MALHLVSGGSGFVGSNIVRLLAARGEAVRVLDIWKDPALPPDVDFILADINDREAVNKAMRGVDYVHHTVALVPLAKAGKRFWTVNVDGTRTALEAARAAGVKMFCHMSSSAVFGSPDIMPITASFDRAPSSASGVWGYSRSCSTGSKTAPTSTSSARAPICFSSSMLTTLPK